jgi:NitT/TauT family transport system permease protein
MVLMNKKILPLILPIIIVLIWTLITMVFNLVPSIFFPNPIQVIHSVYELIISGKLLSATTYTLINVLFGFTLGAIIAIPLGILLGWSKTLEEMGKLVIGILRPIPPIAWVPFSILWFGIGRVPAIFIIFIGCIFPILIYTLDGVKRTDKVLIEAGETLGANNFQIITKIIFPSAIPTIISGLKVGIGIALMCTVSAEMIGATNGIGYLILNSTNLFNTGATIVGMSIIGLIGLTFDIIFTKIQKKIFW